MIRPLRTVIAAALLITGATVAFAGPAAAVPPLAGCTMVSGHYQQAGSYITGYRYWACDEGSIILLNVRVERYLSPGVYEAIAEGRGEATYPCGGTLYNVYRTTGTFRFRHLV